MTPRISHFPHYFAAAFAASVLLAAPPPARAQFGFGSQDWLNTSAPTDAGLDVGVHVAPGAGDTWVAVWFANESFGGLYGEDYDVFRARSNDNGATWSAPTPVNPWAATDSSTPFEENDRDVHIASDRAGTFVIAWDSWHDLGGTVGVDNDILFIRSTDNGATWSAAEPLNSLAGSDDGFDFAPRLATNRLGTWIAVWSVIGGDVMGTGADEDIFFARSTDNGATWSAQAPLNTNATTDSGFDVGPVIMSDGGATWICVWGSNDSLGGTIGTDFDILVSRSTDNGLTWSAPAPLASNAASDTGADARASIATDEKGDWIVVWDATEFDGADRDILTVRSSDNGATWSTVVALNTNAATDSGDDVVARVATDTAGNWLAVWHSHDSLGSTIGTDADILVARSTNNGATWTAPQPLNDDADTDSGGDINPSIAVNPCGSWTWMVAWTSTEDFFGLTGTDGDLLFKASSTLPIGITVCQTGCDFSTVTAALDCIPPPGSTIDVTDADTYFVDNQPVPSGIYLTTSGGATLETSGANTMFILEDTDAHTPARQTEIEGFTLAGGGPFFSVRVANDNTVRITNCNAPAATHQDVVLVERTAPGTPGNLVIEGGSYAGIFWSMVEHDPATLPVNLEVEGITVASLVSGAPLFSLRAPGTYSLSSVSTSGGITAIRLWDTAGAGAGSTLTLTGCDISAFGRGITSEAENVEIVVQGGTFTNCFEGIAIDYAGTPTTPPTLRVYDGATISGSTLAGIRIQTTADLELDGVTLTGTTNGPGLRHLRAAEGNVTITDTTFSDNFNHGIIADNPWISPAGATWTISRSTFIDNQVGDFVFTSANDTNSTLAIDRTLFQQRASGTGNMTRFQRIAATLTNCVFDITDGNAIRIEDNVAQTVQVTHCTVAAGPLNTPSAVTIVAVGPVTIRNSILHTPNNAPVLDFFDVVNEDYNYLSPSFISHTVGANSIVGPDPGFALGSSGVPGTGDFTLAAGSPCPGAGIDLGIAEDFSGDPRPLPAATDPDLGAFESVLVPVELSGFALD